MRLLGRTHEILSKAAIGDGFCGRVTAEVAMLKPRLRIVGRASSLRVQTRGDWTTDARSAMQEACRASWGVDKALAKAIRRARTDGKSWTEIGRILGVTQNAPDAEAVINAFGEHRAAMLRHLLGA